MARCGLRAAMKRLFLRWIQHENPVSYTSTRCHVSQKCVVLRPHNPSLALWDEPTPGRWHSQSYVLLLSCFVPVHDDDITFLYAVQWQYRTRGIFPWGSLSAEDPRRSHVGISETNQSHPYMAPFETQTLCQWSVDCTCVHLYMM